MNNHYCNTDNPYYKYAVKKGYSLIAVIPKTHCVFCGSPRITQESKGEP